MGGMGGREGGREGGMGGREGGRSRYLAGVSELDGEGGEAD